MMRRNLLLMVGLLLCCAPEGAFAQDRYRFSLEGEGGALWLTRNDVRIPNATGTDFSITDSAGKGPYPVYRIETAFDLSERNGIRAVYAPIDVDETAVFDREVFFAGTAFPEGPETEVNYKFNSYRFTYRYRFYQGDTWSWKIGFTAFIRDARIALRKGDLFAEDTDVGFVPLAYLQGAAKIGDRLRFIFDFEGLGASQGRAFDIAAKLKYSLSDHWELGAGYRTIEGGADVDRVYNFAWLHFAVGSLTFRY
jgi:hypothetical protein